MLTTKDYHNNYVQTKTKDVPELKEKLKELEDELETYQSYLDRNRSLISKYTSVEVEEIEQYKNTAPVGRIRFNSRIVIGLVPVEFKLNVNLYIKTKQEIAKLKLKLLELENSFVDYSTYRKINDLFNIKITDEVLNGYEYNLGSRIGKLTIKIKDRKYARPNWELSNKRKAELLQQGVTNLKGPNNPNGVEWLIFYTDPDELWWDWDSASSHIPTKTEYTFVACENLVKRLSEAKKKDEYLRLNFKRK